MIVELNDKRWVTAIDSPDIRSGCSRCKQNAVTLYREYGVFDVNKMYCGACIAELSRPS